jgi:hypothetical protein
LVNADIRAPLHVEAITDLILAGRHSSRMGGADRAAKFNNVSSIWLKHWRAKTPTLLWLLDPKKNFYEADASIYYP